MYTLGKRVSQDRQIQTPYHVRRAGRWGKGRRRRLKEVGNADCPGRQADMWYAGCVYVCVCVDMKIRGGTEECQRRGGGVRGALRKCLCVRTWVGEGDAKCAHAGTYGKESLSSEAGQCGNG